MSNSSLCLNWFTTNGVLYKGNRDRYVLLTADNIFSAIFENKYNESINENDKTLLKSVLSFSKYPIELRIVLHAVAEAEYKIYLNVVAINCDGKKASYDYEKLSDHIIIENVWHPLDYETINETSRILREIKLSAPGAISLGQYLSLLKLNSEIVINDVTGIGQINSTVEDESMPFGLHADLYPYQVRGWRWLKFTSKENIGGILADEMGLGKTLQIIAALCNENRSRVFPSLIIAPSTLLENWRRECEKFAPHIKTLIHQGPQRTGYPNDLKVYDVVISSYDIAIRDSSLFNQINWKFIVCDEAQAIKNPDAKRTVSVKKIPREIGIAVTGTPIENTLTDLWSIMDFAVPGYLGSISEFEKNYPQTVDGASKLEEIISPLILRRKVADVAHDLPEKIIIPQVLELNAFEQEQYETIRNNTVNELQQNSSLAVLTNLRMFCTHPLLLHQYQNDDLEYLSNKYVRLIEIAEEIIANHSKLLLFTSYNKMNDLIREDFNRRFHIFSKSIDGRTPIVDRQNIIDEFSKTSGSAILVLNPVAAGAGLNITAANHVIHYNLEWNPAKEDQASARAYRRGQTLPVTIHRLYYANTVEEAINERLERKRELADSAIVGITGEENEYNDIINALNKSPLK